MRPTMGSVPAAPAALPALSLALLAAACGDPVTKDPDIVVCTPVPGEVCPPDDEGAEAGDDEVGTGEDETTTGEPVALESHECIHNFSANRVGIQYQCEGDLYTSITLSAKGNECADILGGFCDQEHIFGANFQAYAAAEVIACCGEYDFEYAAKYKEHCAYDMYQQTCISLAERVAYYIETGAFGSYAKDAAAVQVWIVDHYDECFAALMNNNSKMLPEVESYWDLGDFGDVHDVVLHIDSGTQLHGVNYQSIRASG